MKITSRPVRVIAAPPQTSRTSAGAAARRSRQTDFAALLRRDPKFPGDAAREQTGAEDRDADEPDDAHGQRRPATLAQCIGQASQRVVGAVLRSERQVLEVARLIASDVAEFATNPAIRQGGHWEVELRIDPRRLPGTQLRLILSPALLSLRFNVEAAPTRALLLFHVGALEHTLRSLLEGHGEPRVLEVSIS
jgi:type III secretion control protein HpaP